MLSTGFEKTHRGYWLALGLGVFVAGIFGAIYMGRYTDTRLRHSLIERARTIAAGVRADTLEQLSGTKQDLSDDNYQDIKAGLIKIREVNDDSQFVYLMGYREGELFFYADSEPADSEDYSPPGQIYAEASAEKITNAVKGVSFAEGPYTDRWGTWVSGYAPVYSESGHVLATAGIDITAKAWKEEIAFARALPIIVALFIILIVWLLYRARRRQVVFTSRLRGEEEKLRVILEDLPIGVFVAKAPGGEPLLANPAAVRLLGRAVDPKVTKEQYTQMFDLVKEDGTPYPVDELPLPMTLKTGQRVTKADIGIRSPDGSVIIVRATSAPIFDETKTRMTAALAVFEDITREREVDKMKSEFISVASHQLRTPLTGIKWFVDLLLRGKAGKLSKDQNDFLKQVAESNERMITLVNDLLNVSRIETGRKFAITLASVDLAPLIQSVVTEHTGLAEKKGIVMNFAPKFPKSIPLMADADKIRQVFQNLVGNAIKYSKEKGAVIVGYKEGNANEAVVYVQDDGVGIPKAQQGKIFQKFFRAENVLNGFEGTGLGLYIAKAIAEGHKGRIWFESEENKGTTFFVALPISKVDPAP